MAPRDPSAYAGAPYSYPEVGATDRPDLPSGYRHLRREVLLGRGDDVRKRAIETVLTFAMHRAAGLGIASESGRATPGEVVVQRIAIGPVGLTAPCRVVRASEDDGRGGGFTYGTLAGHPETGEESFTVEQDDDGAVRFTIRAFSRPGSLLTRLGSPVARVVQDAVIGRYLSGLKDLSNTAGR